VKKKERKNKGRNILTIFLPQTHCFFFFAALCLEAKYNSELQALLQQTY
jgi:hypothetical protein